MIYLNKDIYEKEIVKSDKPVLIDFFAVWCAPCSSFSPIVEELDNESKEFIVCKVDVDKEPELAEIFNVSSIPTIIIMKNGKIVNYEVGVRSKKDLLKMLLG